MFPKKQRVTTELFNGVLKKGRKFDSPLFKATYQKDKKYLPGIFTVVVSGKTESTAVGRNKIKRRLRSAIREGLEDFKSFPVAIIFFAKKEIKNSTYQEIRQEIKNFFGKII